MAAGQGKGEGCRFPFPSTVHEALRASLLIESNKICYSKSIPGRPRKAIRQGNWHSQSNESDVYVASKYFRSLCTRGPFPFVKEKGMLLPIPLDVMISKNNRNVLVEKKEDKIKKMVLFWNSTLRNEFNNSDDFTPYCLPVPVVPPNKESHLKGWWTLQQFSNYLNGDFNFDFTNVSDEQLWKSEYRVGIKIDSETFTAAENQIYASSYMRLKDNCSLLCQAELKDQTQKNQNFAKIELDIDWR
jgi:CRISPR/Cas system CMR-associated protein Cmr3 (group 5 of RAMP superfamily)